MEQSQVEGIAASLVREYLSRKGLKMTLQMMDEEMPRDESSISNRNQLKKVLNLDRLMEKNKESDSPLKAMLEVMAKSFGEKNHKKSGSMKTSRGGDMTDRSNSGEEEPGRSPQSSSYQRGTTPSGPGLRGSTPSSTGYSGYSGLTHSGSSQPGLSYSGSRTSGPSRLRVAGKSDIVIEDDIEGETILGDGRAGILGNQPEDVYVRQQTSDVPRPKSRLRGMAGPIASSTEDRRGRSARVKSGLRPSSGRPKPTSGPTLVTPETTSDRIPDTTSGSDVTNRLDSGSSPQIPTDSGRTLSSGYGSRDLYSSSLSSRKEPITDVLQEDYGKSRSKSHDLESPDNEDSDTSSDSKPSAAPRYRRDDTLLQYGVSKSCIVSEKTPKPVNFLDAVNNTKPKTTKVGDIEIGDVDDLDADLGQLDLRPRKPLMSSALITDSKPIDIQTAVELKTLCFGTASKSFNEEWTKQGFTFCNYPKLTYGIVQKKGGPCGVLACVQAAMLKQLLFLIKREPPRNNKLYAPPEDRSEALALGLADILWAAGDKERAVVALPSARSIFSGSGRYRPDHLTETLVLNHFKTYEDLANFLKDSVHQFEDVGQPGVVLTVYSAILSRTVKKVKEDMDEPDGKLIGAHNYCTQDLVNLLLIGEAVSNTFNDYVLLDTCKLKGCSRRAEIGFLSLFEHYKSCEVGTYLKTPKYPIWVVCSESHFSVLFCQRKDLISDWRVERRFDLYYYDGLANQDEEIRLTVVTSNRGYRPPPRDDDLIPPLELCIGTKWAEAEIDWNGTEPLL